MTFIYSPRYEIDIGPHVYPTAKYRLVRDRLIAEGVAGPSDFLEPEAASPEELALIHTPEFLDDLEHLRRTRRTMYSELPLTRSVVDAYRIAAGGTILAARLALDRVQKIVVHMGGGWHHAFADHAEGFCYINDIAVAIRVFESSGRIGRAMVVDLDVHQGNGTAHIFQDDPDVFTISIHQEDNYPIKQRSNVDIGLPDHIGDDEYLRTLESTLGPAMNRHQPDLLIYVAGADPYEDDQLGGLKLTMDGLRRRDELVLKSALHHHVPAVVVFAGGYARRLDDTVAIHAQTCRIAKELAGET